MGSPCTGVGGGVIMHGCRGWGHHAWVQGVGSSCMGAGGGVIMHGCRGWGHHAWVQGVGSSCMEEGGCVEQQTIYLGMSSHTQLMSMSCMDSSAA